MFDRVGRESEELAEDLDCLALLEAAGATADTGSVWTRTYRFPEQGTKLRAGDRINAATAEGPRDVTIEALDRRRCRATLCFSKRKWAAAPERLDLIPGWPLDTGVIEGAIGRVIDDFCAGGSRYRPVEDLLDRAPPRLAPMPLGPVMGPGDPVGETVAAVAALDGGVLPVQGPPGTGKTYTAARAILHLVRQGKRVAVACQSHEAVANVLMACVDALREDDPDIEVIDLELAHKITSLDQKVPEAYRPYIANPMRPGDAVLRRAAIVGGTAWLFSRPEFDGTFDALFVDEAGQVSLANAVAMGTCARNIVLIGDPMQLPQVVQGGHPEQAGLSALEYLLGEARTVPADRGIFLPITRRMHPALCGFVSRQVYEGRLQAHADTARQAVLCPGLPEAGARLVPVPHEGNAQESPEEVAAIAATVDRLTGGRWRDREGRERPLRHEDVIVVAPYNAQVNALRDALPERVRVGTVDKFQGKQAAVCLVSMTTSSAEELPRDIAFLFSLNRINVAISRAKALSLVFASPRLLEVPCATLDQMRLVNTLCALAEEGCLDLSAKEPDDRRAEAIAAAGGAPSAPNSVNPPVASTTVKKMTRIMAIPPLLKQPKVDVLTASASCGGKREEGYLQRAVFVTFIGAAVSPSRTLSGRGETSV